MEEISFIAFLNCTSLNIELLYKKTYKLQHVNPLSILLGIYYITSYYAKLVWLLTTVLHWLCLP